MKGGIHLGERAAEDNTITLKIDVYSDYSLWTCYLKSKVRGSGEFLLTLRVTSTLVAEGNLCFNM
jgi:hypothetical protein